MKIKPLNGAQLAKLPKKADASASPVRILYNGCAVDIVTGQLSSPGSNIIYHPVYWNRCAEFVDLVLSYLSENNPDGNFKVSYH